MSERESAVYGVGITLLPQIGPTRAKQLLSCCGSLEEVFTLSRKELMAKPGMRPQTVELVMDHRVRALEEAKRELDQLDKTGGRCLWYHDMHYPKRLKECEDAPMVLYYRGKVELNAPFVVAIVGTRRATAYGRAVCEELVEGLKPLGATVVSGLAFGVDAIAHRSALRHQLPTIGCVAHGLHTLYPPEHRTLSHEMEHHGGLVTEFTTGQRMCAELFPMRNRIIAGLADVTVVIESDVKGGSMITAYLAHGYNREVFAVPGRVDDRSSRGCNELIHRQVAEVYLSPTSFLEAMNWKMGEKPPLRQLELFASLSPEQEQVRRSFDGRQVLTMDELTQLSGFNLSQLSGLLLEMEFEGMIRSRPGNCVELITYQPQRSPVKR